MKDDLKDLMDLIDANLMESTGIDYILLGTPRPVLDNALNRKLYPNLVPKDGLLIRPKES